MRRLIFLGLVATLSLSACATVRESRINPFNWFGGSREEPIRNPVASDDNPLIPERVGFFQRRRLAEQEYLGSPIDTVTDLVIERVPGGAIVRASGQSRYVNIYEIQLTPANEDEEPVDGVLEYRLEARIPASPVGGGTERQRTVTAARALTDLQLRDVRQIRVTAQQNARVSGRR